MNIVVLAGGYSPERDVSLSSGSLIANSLMRSGHRVLLVDAFLGMEIDEGVNPHTLFRSLGDAEYSYTIPEVAPDMEALKKLAYRGSLVGHNVLRLCRAADIVFMALHGAMGENGQMQAILEAENIRFTGSTHVGCVLAMDKDITKKLLAAEGIPVAKGLTLDLSKESFPDEHPMPCVVKPCSCGSSVGVSIVESEAALTEALAAATLYEGNVLIERKVTGREFSVGILGGKALPPIEIIPIAGFYDYKNKYQSGMTRELCPAPLTKEENASLADAALKAFHALRLRGYARIDFILEETTGTFIFLEANTLPGMTPTSLLPQEAAAAGIRYEELCDIIARM